MTPTLRDDILSAISDANSFDDLGRKIVEACAHAFDAELCTIWRRYTDDTGRSRLRLLSASGKAPQTIAQEITYAINEDSSGGRNADGVTGFVAETRQEVHVSSFKELQDKYGFCWKGRLDKAQWSGRPAEFFRSLSAFPLVLGKRLVGVLKVENKRGSFDGFPEGDRRAVREIAPDIALAVHSFSLLEPHEEKLIQVPAQLVRALLSPFDPKQLLREIVKEIAHSLPAEICSLWLVDPSGKELRLADGYGFSTEARVKQTYQLAEPNVPDKEIDGITAWVAIRKKPFWANSWKELKDHPSWKGKWDKEMWNDRGQAFRCLYAVPLVRQNSVIGVLKVENRIGGAIFTNSDRAMCGILANLIILLDLAQQLRSSVVSELVHLIRSPIGQVSMNLSGLMREIDNLQEGRPFHADRVEEYVNFVKKALLSATVTSRTLVAFAQRVGTLDSASRQEGVPLIELVEERVKEIQPLLYSGITIRSNVGEDLRDASVYLDVTDKTWVQTVIDNILHNAIKYSRKNGVVEVNLKKGDSGAELTIEDFGEGIAPEDLPRIFEPGFSRRAPGHPQGTGMGLTTVKQILNRLNWPHDVRSKPGEGTVFAITIPIR
jgi:signal transduction histidine kinase